MALVLALVVGCSGGSGEATSPGSTARPGELAPRSDASTSSSAELRATLTAELESRVHLLSARSRAGLADADATVASIDRALDDRRRSIAAALEAAGGAGGLVTELAAHEDLVRDYADARGPSARRGVRIRITTASSSLGAVVEELTRGRLPSDVATPLAVRQLSSLLDVVDAGRRDDAAGAADADEAARASVGRLVEPLVIALGAEAGWTGAAGGGDAARLRASLTSILVSHAFGASAVALGDPGGADLVLRAGDRLEEVLAASYGAGRGADVADRWRAQGAAAAESARVTASATVAGEQAGGTDLAADPAVPLATQRSDEATAELARVVAELVGEPDLEPWLVEVLGRHRGQLVVFHVAAERERTARAWRGAGAVGVDHADVAARLASAITVQKSLG